MRPNDATKPGADPAGYFVFVIRSCSVPMSFHLRHGGGQHVSSFGLGQIHRHKQHLHPGGGPPKSYRKPQTTAELSAMGFHFLQSHCGCGTQKCELARRGRFVNHKRMLSRALALVGIFGGASRDGAVDWIMPGLITNQPVWGLRGGILSRLHWTAEGKLLVAVTYDEETCPCDRPVKW
jgi:hypothetical protein